MAQGDRICAPHIAQHSDGQVLVRITREIRPVARRRAAVAHFGDAVIRADSQA